MGSVARVEVRIVRPAQGEVDGVQFDLVLGRTYDLPSPVALLLVCEGYAEPFIDCIDDRRKPDSGLVYRGFVDRRRPN